MSFQLPKDIKITKVERRTCELHVVAYNMRGNNFQTVMFNRESVFLADSGEEVKRINDPQAFEFTPEQISQDPRLQSAIDTLFLYMDLADRGRLQQQQQQQA